MMVPRKQQIQDQLYDMAGLSMMDIAAIIVDLNIQHELDREKVKELEGLEEEHTTLKQEFADLNADYTTLLQSSRTLVEERDALAGQVEQLKGLIQLTNYQKEIV